MNIDKQTFNTLDVLYDDKKWGKRIDPDEWNANFKVLEEGHNELAVKLNQQVTDIDTAIQAATSSGGQNISVQYGAGTETLQVALDNVVSDINNRYTKNEVDATVGSNTNSLIANAEYNESTGVFTFTRKDGSKVVIDTVIEKVPASMALVNESDGSVSLVVTNQDGSTTKTNVTSLIEDTVINSSDTVNATSVTDSVKKVTTYTLVIKPNSIGLSHIDSALTAKFEETQSAKTAAIQAKDNAVSAQNAAIQAKNNAETYASNANTYSTNASVSANESADSALEAKGYAEQAASYKNSAESAKVAAEKARDEAQAIVGGTVQPDWNVNDETSSEYIKNRPFYTGDLVETYVVQNALLSLNQSSDSVKIYNFPSSFNLVTGTTYKVYWNGVVYERVCSIFNDSFFVIGNLSIAQLGNDTGEPFLIATDNQSAYQCYTTDTAETPSVSISTLAPKIVKIDEKYLPVATDDSYGAVKTSNLVYAYNFPVFVNSSDIIEAIEQFKKSKANIIWNGSHITNVFYDSSDSSICTRSAERPFVVSKHVKGSDENKYGEYIREIYDVKEAEVNNIAFTKKGSSDTSYKRYILDVSDGVLEFDSKPIAYKSSFKITWLEVSKWDLSAKTYNFETDYPNSSYDIEIALDSTATTAQAEAFNGAQIVGSATSNVVKAYGTVPTVDIPVIIKVVIK